MRDTYNPEYESLPDPAARRFRFRAQEVRSLVIATVGLTLAMAFIRTPPEVSGIDARMLSLVEQPRILVAAAAAVVVGFIGHEIAHKLVAQHYGHFAEFRLWWAGLGLGIFTAVLARFIFALPGAVYIMGHVSRRENGLISIVGPGVNIVIAAAALPFTFTTDIDADLPFVMGTVALVNGLLAVFNMIPAGPFDGRKVWQWNRAAWAATFLTGLALFLVTFVRIVPAPA